MSRTIASRASWGARFVAGVGNRPVGSLQKYLHHSVTRHLPVNATVAQERVECRTVERIGQQRFGRGISYTILIFPSGRIYWGAGIGRISYHSGGGNDGKPRNTIGAGICLVGNTHANDMTQEQEDSLVWLLRHGVRQGWWSDPAITEGHRDFKATSCPGDYAYRRIDRINRRARGGSYADFKKNGLPADTDLSGSAPAEPAPKPSKPSKGQKSGRVPHTDWTVNVDGDFGYYTKIALQNVLRHRGYRTHAMDGDFGRYSIMSLQRFLRAEGQRGHAIDGKWGQWTTRSLQQWLRAQGYTGHAVDGSFGPYTIRSLQQALIDGKFFRR